MSPCALADAVEESEDAVISNVVELGLFVLNRSLPLQVGDDDVWELERGQLGGVGVQQVVDPEVEVEEVLFEIAFVIDRVGDRLLGCIDDRVEVPVRLGEVG